MQVLRAYYRTTKQGNFPKESILEEETGPSRIVPLQPRRGVNPKDQVGNELRGGRESEVMLEGIRKPFLDDLHEKDKNQEKILWRFELEDGPLETQTPMPPYLDLSRDVVRFSIPENELAVPGFP